MTFITVAALQAQGDIQFQHHPTSVELMEMARALDLLELPHYSAHVHFKLQHDGSVVVRGTIDAVAVQACVSSGMPVRTKVQHNINVKYMPDHRFAVSQKRDGLDIVLDSAQPEDIEPLPANGIDPYALLHEEMVLALPVYPRLNP